MNDTPRTDAAITRCACSSYVVEPDFARELERENAALRDALVQAKDDMEKCMETGKLPAWSLDCVRAALNAARKEQP